MNKINAKDQLLFQKLKSTTQQRNLILVDSAFVLLLSDLTIETLLGKVSCFSNYIYKKRDFTILPKLDNYKYLFYKFSRFADLLLFSDIAKKKPSRGNYHSYKIYYLKREREIEYYSLFLSKDQRDFILNCLKVKIITDESFIRKRTAIITLQIFI